MKKKTIIIFLLFSLNSFSQNKIDKLKNNNDVNLFIIETTKEYKYFNVGDTNYILYEKKYKDIADSLKMRYWVKTDFDQNGQTDIIAYANTGGHVNLTVVMAFPDDKYEVKQIDKGILNSFKLFPIIDTIDKTPIIKLYWTKESEYPLNRMPDTTNDTKLFIDTLIYKYDDFIEYNSNPSKLTIEDISISTGMCYGDCPVFDMQINKNGKAKYQAKLYNTKKGNFSGVINRTELDKLFELLNYINFEKLKDNYAISSTDHQTAILSITYNGGQKKIIKDYGLRGTYGLNRVYNVLYNLKETQKWK